LGGSPPRAATSKTVWPTVSSPWVSTSACTLRVVITDLSMTDVAAEVPAAHEDDLRNLLNEPWFLLQRRPHVGERAGRYQDDLVGGVR
jgi:hypothetical protein